MRFDYITINFIDDDTDQEFTYYMYYDSGEDNTRPKQFLDKLMNDSNLADISQKLDKIRDIIGW